jgi:hypothetical protein
MGKKGEVDGLDEFIEWLRWLWDAIRKHHKRRRIVAVKIRAKKPKRKKQHKKEKEHGRPY